MTLGHRTTRPRYGFTIIELLVSIGIIGVLIGITAPALFRAKTSAGRVQSLANLHNLALSLQAYALANQSRNPFPPSHNYPISGSINGYFGPITQDPSGDPRDTPESPHVFFTPIWNMDVFWPGVMHQVAPWPEHYESWLSPGRLAQEPSDATSFEVSVSYHYSNSFLASPRVWGGSAGVTKADIGPTRVTDVAHPSNKVIMYDSDRSYLRQAPTPSDPRPLLFADGSASARRDSDATPGTPNPLNNGSKAIYHNTPNGVLGRDF